MLFSRKLVRVFVICVVSFSVILTEKYRVIVIILLVRILENRINNTAKAS